MKNLMKEAISVARECKGVLAEETGWSKLSLSQKWQIAWLTLSMLAVMIFASSWLVFPSLVSLAWAWSKVHQNADIEEDV